MTQESVPAKTAASMENAEKIDVVEFKTIKELAKIRLAGQIIGKLISSWYYVTKDANVLDVANELNLHYHISAIGVVDDTNKVIGIIVRKKFFDVLGRPYGRDVYKNKTVTALMQGFTSFDVRRNIFSVVEKLAKVLRQQNTEYFVLTDKDVFFSGIFTSQDLLIYLSDMSQKEIAIAKRLQMHIVKEDEYIHNEYFELQGCSSMAKGIGGDYYKVEKYSDHKWIISICDVSGKGVSASLVTAVISGMFDMYDFHRGIGSFVYSLNEFAVRTFDTEKFITGVFLDMDETTGEISLVDLGHSYIYLLRNNKFYNIKFENDNLPIGVFPDLKADIIKLQLRPNDILMLTTDGIFEQRNPAGDEYGLKRMIQIFRDNQHKSCRAIKELMLADLEEFRETQPQGDDLTLILLKKHAEQTPVETSE